jgi:hypothetical protein
MSIAAFTLARLAETRQQAAALGLAAAGGPARPHVAA